MENLVVNTKKKVTLEKFSSSVKVSAQNEIKSILNVSARSIINSAEQANNVVTLSGKIFVNVIYQTVENLVASAETVVDFIEKQQLVIKLSEMVATDEVDINIDTFSGTEILCSVTHNTEIFGIYIYEVADFVGENTAFVLNKKSLVLNKLIGSKSEDFVVAEENESNIKNMNVLHSTAKVLSFETSSAVDKVVVDGKVLVETIYSDGDAVSLLTKEFEFKQEIEIKSAMPNMQVYTVLEAKNVTVTPEEKEDKTNIVYAIDIFAKAYLYEENTYEVATDMFSLDSVIQNTYDYLDIQKNSSSKQVTDVVMSSTNVSEIEDFDDIIGVYLPKVKMTNITSFENKIIAEILISAFAFYKSKDEVKRLEIAHSAKVEFEKDINEIFNDFKSVAEISSFKVKAGKELEVAFKVASNISFDVSITESFVKSFEIKDAKPENGGGIKVYVTKEGETLFEVARILNVRPELIEEQNEVDGVFEQGEKIYVYSPLNCL